MEDLAQDVWEVYGFKGNPYLVKPLTFSNDLLPLLSAFVGRNPQSPEFSLMTNTLRNPGGNSLVLEGEIGVGKTTFVNYHRYLWEYKSRDKLLSPLQEIGVSFEWTLKDFLFNVLCALTYKLLSTPSLKKKVSRKKFFQELEILTKVYAGKSQTLNGGALGVQFGMGKNEVITVPELGEVQMLHYFQQLVVEIQQLGYAGILLPFDNLELISRAYPDRIRHLFEEIRDTLQTSDVYFVFVGYPGFFSEIITPLERVRSIFFGHPIVINPLSQEEVVEVFRRRYEILSQGNSYIPPVEEEFILYLYELFQGKIRLIMDSMNTLIPNIRASRGKTLKLQDAQKELFQITSRRFAYLSSKEKEVLEKIIPLPHFTNAQICKRLKMPSSNVARILNSLRDNNMISIDRVVGRNTYYRVQEEIKVIAHKSYRKVFASGKKFSSAFNEEQFLKNHFQNRSFTRQEFQDLCGLSLSTAYRKLKEMIAEKIVLQSGKGKNTTYQMA